MTLLSLLDESWLKSLLSPVDTVTHHIIINKSIVNANILSMFLNTLNISHTPKLSFLVPLN